MLKSIIILIALQAIVSSAKITPYNYTIEGLHYYPLITQGNSSFALEVMLGGEQHEMVPILYSSQTILNDECQDTSYFDCRKLKKNKKYVGPFFNMSGQLCEIGITYENIFENHKAKAIYSNQCNFSRNTGLFDGYSQSQGIIGLANHQKKNGKNVFKSKSFSIWLSKWNDNFGWLVDGFNKKFAKDLSKGIVFETNKDWSFQTQNISVNGITLCDQMRTIYPDISTDMIWMPSYIVRAIVTTIERNTNIQCDESTVAYKCLADSFDSFPVIKIGPLTLNPDLYIDTKGDQFGSSFHLKFGLTETFPNEFNEAGILNNFKESIILGTRFFEHYVGHFQVRPKQKLFIYPGDFAYKPDFDVDTKFAFIMYTLSSILFAGIIVIGFQFIQLVRNSEKKKQQEYSYSIEDEKTESFIYAKEQPSGSFLDSTRDQTLNESYLKDDVL